MRLEMPVRPESTLDETKVPALGEQRAVPVKAFRPNGDLNAPKFLTLEIDPLGCVSLLVSWPV